MRKETCNLTDDQLVTKADAWITKLIETGGRCWSLPIPANPDRDVDLILAELAQRFKRTIEKDSVKSSQADTKYIDLGRKIEQAFIEDSIVVRSKDGTLDPYFQRRQEIIDMYFKGSWQKHTQEQLLDMFDQVNKKLSFILGI